MKSLASTLAPACHEMPSLRGNMLLGLSSGGGVDDLLPARGGGVVLHDRGVDGMDSCPSVLGDGVTTRRDLL